MPAVRTPTGTVRRSLIDAGHRVLASDGTAGLTVRAVAAEAGVAPMGVYNHLGGKDGLLKALIDDGFEQLGATTKKAQAAQPWKRLREAGHAYRDFALAHPTLYRLMFSGTHELGGDTGIAALGVLAEIVSYGQAKGEFRDDDAFILTVTIWSCVHGAVSLELDTAESAPVDVDRDVLYTAVLDLIERGLSC